MEPEEIWKDVVGFPTYQVSSLGRIRGPRSVLSPHFTRGYYQVQLSHKGRMYTRRLGRLVCEAFHGPAPTEGMDCLHRDDVGTNNIPSNLYWGTDKENIEDQRINGSLGKVGWIEVREMRKLHKEGVRQFELSKRYKIGQSNVSQIINNKIWIE